MKKILLFLLFPISVFGQSFKTDLGRSLDGSKLRELFQEQPARLKLRHGSSMGLHTFFDTEKEIAYQGFGYSSGRRFEAGEFDNYINLHRTQLLSSEVELSEDQKIFIHGFLNFSNDFFILYSINDKRNNEERVYINQMSKEMVILGSPILLMTFEEKRDSSAPLYFTSSPDKKSFAVVREYQRRNVTENVLIKAFNQNFQELYKESIDVSSIQDLFVLKDVAISNNGRLYLYGGIDPRADNLFVFTGAKDKSVPFLLAYQPESKTVKEISIAEPEVKKYYSYKFFLTETNEPAALSVYKAGRKTAYTVSHIDDKTTTVDWQLKDVLSPAAVSAAKKGKSKRKFLKVVSFTQLLGGEYVASLETNFVTSSRTRYFSNSGAIILLGLEKSGEEAWERVINKHHKLPGTDLHSSHKAFANSSGLLLVYNDDFRNLASPPARRKVKKLKKTKKAVAVGVEVSADGKVEKFLLSGAPKGLVLDMYHFPKIKDKLYQFRLSSYKSFGRFETTYGKLELK
ncbi:hypothetical protein [Nafulsella turpanensis]|uniref:hypothetical protein n=1 Tax=Nafulsella turpanensis TaxID=1265690 RepID=UPI00034C3BAB|nr:hypothetical protein [Nafulsella turpanensis]